MSDWPCGLGGGQTENGIVECCQGLPVGLGCFVLLIEKAKGLLLKGLPLLGGKNGKRSPGSCPGAHCGSGLGARLTGWAGVFVYLCAEPGGKGGKE